MSRTVPKFIRLDKPASADCIGIADTPIGFMLSVWQKDVLIHLSLLPASAEQNLAGVLEDMNLSAALPRDDARARELVKTTLFPDHQWTGRFNAANTPVLGFYGTDFQWDVMQHMLRIPSGKTATYQSLAQLAGSERAARAAGSICARNPIPFIIPCHRVLASNGGFGGYAFGTALKRELLRLEKSVA